MDLFKRHVYMLVRNKHVDHGCGCCFDPSRLHGRGKKIYRRVGRRKFKSETARLIREQTI